MKTIPGNTPGAQWSSGLLDDLAFIKQHLRYPFSKKTLPSAFIIVLFLFGISRVLLPLLFIRGRNPVVDVVFMAIIVVVVLLACYQYLRTLRFAVIPTPFPAEKNRQLVEHFLKSQQLATYTHPQAPEVLQIVSRALGNSKREQREIMIFIADDNRILINSHFINQRFSITQASHNYRQMANRLREWMRIQYPDVGLIG